jgi:hypothetical protein
MKQFFLFIGGESMNTCFKSFIDTLYLTIYLGVISGTSIEQYSKLSYKIPPKVTFEVGIPIVDNNLRASL